MFLFNLNFVTFSILTHRCNNRSALKSAKNVCKLLMKRWQTIAINPPIIFSHRVM